MTIEEHAALLRFTAGQIRAGTCADPPGDLASRIELAATTIERQASAIAVHLSTADMLRQQRAQQLIEIEQLRAVAAWRALAEELKVLHDKRRAGDNANN